MTQELGILALIKRDVIIFRSRKPFCAQRLLTAGRIMAHPFCLAAGFTAICPERGDKLAKADQAEATTDLAQLGRIEAAEVTGTSLAPAAAPSSCAFCLSACRLKDDHPCPEK
jgi:hypothetical protein